MKHFLFFLAIGISQFFSNFKTGESAYHYIFTQSGNCVDQQIVHRLLLILDIGPVSYTHLDVYKRQPRN